MQSPIDIINTHMINEKILKAFYALPSINQCIVKMAGRERTGESKPKRTNLSYIKDDIVFLVIC